MSTHTSKIYFEKIYESTFGSIAENSSKLNIISGYASANMLSRVIKDFPNLEINLFIGMTNEGISKRNHSEFQKIMVQNEKVTVYYQITGKPTHIKLYQFLSSVYNSERILIGSANFSETGFLNNRELLTETDEDVEYIFIEQLKISLPCIDDSIINYIKIYDENLENDTTVLEEIQDYDKNKGEMYYSQKKIMNSMLETFRGNFKLLKSRIDSALYNEFEITVIVSKDNNHRWKTTGINAWMDGREPVLEQTPKLLFNKVFPENKEFKIYLDDSKVWIARLTGNFNGKLEVLNIDLFGYMLERLGLSEKRPISFEQLDNNGFSVMYFKRINETEYIMSFDKENLREI